MLEIKTKEQLSQTPKIGQDDALLTPNSTIDSITADFTKARVRKIVCLIILSAADYSQDDPVSAIDRRPLSNYSAFLNAKLEAICTKELRRRFFWN